MHFMNLFSNRNVSSVHSNLFTTFANIIYLHKLFNSKTSENAIIALYNFYVSKRIQEKRTNAVIAE